MVSIGSRFPGREVVRLATDTGDYEHALPRMTEDALRLQSALLRRPLPKLHWTARARLWLTRWAA